MEKEQQTWNSLSALARPRLRHADILVPSPDLCGSEAADRE
jgi:hypothetical protein